MSSLSKRIAKERNEYLKDISDGIDYNILKDFIRISKKINIFIWCSRDQIYEILKFFKENTETYFSILVWCKTNPTPATNNSWLPDIEYCLHFRENGVIFNDGYELKSKYYLTPINKWDKDLFNHPTIKPLKLVERHLKHTTQENDIVLDCFCGSGTTCVAAQETGRRFIGIEINEEYYNIAKDRLNGLTQKDRIQINNGQTSLFD